MQRKGQSGGHILGHILNDSENNDRQDKWCPIGGAVVSE